MTLAQLTYFETACRLESITRAAEQLHISQPSVSAAIRELEAEFGYALLDRQGRRFALTREGRVFWEEARRLLAHAGDFEHGMLRLARHSRPIALGLPPMIGSLVLPALLAPGEEAPAPFRLDITEGGRRELLQQLADGRLDMAFLPHDRPLEPHYRFVPVAELETVCCVSARHPLARRSSVTIRALEGHPLVLFKESFFQTERILDAFGREGVKPNILLQTSQLSTVRRLVAQNLAAGFLFRQLAGPAAEMVSVPLDPPMKAQVSLVWRGTDHLPGEHLRFIEQVRALAGSGF